MPVDHRPEVHLREDVALDVDAGRDLDQLQPFGAQPEHAALGDVEHRLAALGTRSAPLKVRCSTVAHELRGRPSLHDPQLPVATATSQAAGA